MKVVLDTNIFISSFFWGGNPRKIIERIINGEDTLFICNEILSEINSVISRPKFNVENRYITRFIKSIEDIANHVTLKGMSQQICRDKEDDKIIECALLSKAQYIITGDTDLLVLDEYQGIKIITSNEYISNILMC